MGSFAYGILVHGWHTLISIHMVSCRMRRKSDFLTRRWWIGVAGLGTIVLVVVGILQLVGVIQQFTNFTKQPELPQSSQSLAVKTYVIQDDFSGPLQWEEQAELPGPGLPQPPQISKKIKIESRALHIFAESWWYSAYAVRNFSELKNDFEASCSFRVMPDSAQLLIF